MDSKENSSPPVQSKRLMASWIILILLALFSFQAWASVYEAVLVPGGSNFVQPLLWFSLIIIAFSLESILLEKHFFEFLVSAAVFLPSLFFAQTIAHFLFLGVSMAFTILSLRSIQSELGERLHLSLRKSLLAGLSFFLLGLSLTLSSQYYVHAETLSWEKLIPSFNLSERNASFLFSFLGSVYPPLNELEDKEVTVDAFLQTLGPRPDFSDEALAPGMLGMLSVEYRTTTEAELEQSMEELLLTRKRDNLSELVGRPVRGDENISKILSEVMRKKVLNLVVSDTNTAFPVPVIPAFLAFLLFLSVYPLASLFLFVWAFGAGLVFTLLSRLRIVSIIRVMVEKEEIAH